MPRMPAMPRRLRGLAIWAVLALIAFVLVHELIFLLAYGSAAPQVLASTGHGTDWDLTIVVVVGLAVSLVTAAGMELARLTRAAEGAPSRHRPLFPQLTRATLRFAPIVAVLSGAILVVNENLERLGAHEPLPGLSVLGGPEYPITLPVLAAVSLLVAFVAAVYRVHRDELVERLRAARLAFPRPSATLRRPSAEAVPRRNPLAHRLAGRAPPAFFLVLPAR